MTILSSDQKKHTSSFSHAIEPNPLTKRYLITKTITMKTICTLFALIFSVCTVAQEHHHDRNEVGISPGVTYSPSHNSWGAGIHAHYFRTLSVHSPWALGVSIEQVYSDGTHWTVSVGGKYRILNKLNIAVMPGITFLKNNHEEDHGDEHGHEYRQEYGHERHSKTQFSMHVEVSYDLIHFKNVHLGPAIDYSWSKHDTHFMIGVHCAYGF